MANGYVGGSRIDVKNKHDQHATIHWDGGKLKAHLGGTKAVGNGEFRDLIGGQLNVNKRDNDIEDIFLELLTGRTKGNPKEDGDDVIGIDGVELIGLTKDSFTIAISNGRSVDTLTFEGAGVADMIAKFGDNTANFGDAAKNNKVTLNENDSAIGTGPISDLVGGNVGGGTGNGAVNDRTNLLEAAIDPSDDRVKLLGLEEDNFAVQVVNGDKVDTVIFTGESAEAAIDSVTSGDKITPENATNDALILDAPYGGNESFQPGNDEGPIESFTGIELGGSLKARDVNGKIDNNPNNRDVILDVNEADPEAILAVIDQGDTVRIEFIDDKGTSDTGDDTRDVLVVPDDPGNDITPGGGANDLLDYNNVDVA